jgi:hypothetical protein
MPHISNMKEHSLELRGVTKDDALVILIRRSVNHWNNGDLKSFSERFREDAVLSLPSIDGMASNRLYFGRDEIAQQLSAVRSKHGGFNMVDVSSNGALYTVLLTDGARYLTFVVEPDHASGLIRRMSICRTLLHSHFHDTALAAA